MTSTTSMENIPSNHGYLENGHKWYGYAQSNGEDNVKLVECSKRHIHRWARHGYTEWKLNTEEKDEDGWVAVGKRQLVANREMTPCPHELEHNGECPQRFEAKHKAQHYHFARWRGDNVVRNTEGKPLCRWHISGNKKCWEARNGPHRKLFAHR
jgi:hypothetical protein